MDSTTNEKSTEQVQPWKKLLANEMGEVKEGEAKQEWHKFKPNAENPGEKPWINWNKGEGGTDDGMRDDRPHNATCYIAKLNEKESN